MSTPATAQHWQRRRRRQQAAMAELPQSKVHLAAAGRQQQELYSPGTPGSAACTNSPGGPKGGRAVSFNGPPVRCQPSNVQVPANEELGVREEGARCPVSVAGADQPVLPADALGADLSLWWRPDCRAADAAGVHPHILPFLSSDLPLLPKHRPA